LTLALAGCGERPGRYAIVGATLMDGTALPPVAPSVVLVDHGIITAMGARGTIEIPASARVIYATGRFVFPLKLDQPLAVEGPADLILCNVNPARDPDYLKKTSGQMEAGRWTQYPN
jgi:hypothetical protein